MRLTKPLAAAAVCVAVALAAGAKMSAGRGVPLALRAPATPFSLQDARCPVAGRAPRPRTTWVQLLQYGAGGAVECRRTARAAPTII